MMEPTRKTAIASLKSLVGPPHNPNHWRSSRPILGSTWFPIADRWLSKCHCRALESYKSARRACERCRGIRISSGQLRRIHFSRLQMKKQKLTIQFVNHIDNIADLPKIPAAIVRITSNLIGDHSRSNRWRVYVGYAWNSLSATTSRRQLIFAHVTHFHEWSFSWMCIKLPLDSP